MTHRSPPGATAEPSVLLRSVNNVMKQQHQARHSGVVTKPLRVHTWAQTEHTLQVTERIQLAILGDVCCFINPRFSLRPVIPPLPG